jgi:hypothetical protein
MNKKPIIVNKQEIQEFTCFKNLLYVFPAIENATIEKTPFKIDDEIFFQTDWWQAYGGTYNAQAWDEYSNVVRWLGDPQRYIQDVSIIPDSKRWHKMPAESMRCNFAYYFGTIKDFQLKPINMITDDEFMHTGYRFPTINGDFINYPSSFKEYWNQRYGSKFSWDNKPLSWFIEIMKKINEPQWFKPL